MEFPYSISEELLRVLMLGAIRVNYQGEGISPTHFDAEHPPPMGHQLTGMILEPPLHPSVVEWEWMVMPPTRTSNVPTLVFSPPRQ